MLRRSMRGGPDRRPTGVGGRPVTAPGRASGPPGGGPEGGPYRDTDPPARPGAGLPCGPGGGSAEALTGYVHRSMERRAALQQLDALCFWHLFLVDMSPECRAITAARRELHVRLQNDQTRDDLEYARAVNS